MGGGKPKKKQVKIMLIVSKFDPKTKAIDTENGHVEHLTGLMDTETGLIDTKYGQIDPKKATLESYNPETNKVELFKGELDGKTGNLHFTSGGVVDPRTGKVDNTLGEIVSIVPEENPVVELTCITSRIDPKTKKIDTVNGDLEYSPAVLDIENQVLHTKYGQIHLKTGELKVVDPKTGKVISSSKNVTLDPVTQQIIINGVVDPKTGKLDPTQGRLIEVGQQIDPLVEVSTISGKLDSKKNTIDPKTADFEKSTGQYNPKTGKVDTKYGQLDLVKQTLTSIDPKTGKSVVKDVKIDPVSGQVVLKNQINPKTGKHDKDYGLTKKPILSPEDAIVDPVTNQIWTPTGAVDPITKEKQYVSSTVDPKTGTIITIYGYLNPKTNEIRKQTKIDGNLVKVDPDTGKIFTATGETDKNGEPLFATTEFDPATGEVYTKVGKVDPKTKKIVLVKILLLSKPDPTTGRPQEVDPDTCDIDPTTGRVTKFFNKTVYVYNMVDPITGDIIQVDPNDPRIAGAKTTVTQTMTLSGEVDPKTGRIKTEWGHIDPKTGDIDPKTAVKDPVTGKLILNYAQIDPSHFGKEVTVTKETVPITREQFFDGIKHLGKDKIRRSSIASSDDDEMAEYSLEQTPQKQTAPTVVQTTTKQTITKTDDGVPTMSKKKLEIWAPDKSPFQHKNTRIEESSKKSVSPTKEQTPKRISEPVVTAAVAKPSKQSHDFTSAFLEGERYNKEPAYASPEKKATTTTTETVTKVASPPSPTKTVTSAKAVASPTVPEFASASTAFVPEPLADVVKEKPVKVLSIISKVDPKTKRIDIENGKVEQIEAKLNPTTGLIKTKYGTLNPAKGTLENIATKEVVQGTIDPKTGTIQFTNDPAHGQILSVVPNDKTFVELTVVSSKFEPNTKNINPLAEDAQLEKCVGVLDIENGTLDTKYGQLCTKTGEIRTIDPKTGKVHVTKNAIVTDPSSGQIKIVGLPDPKTVISVAGKMDKKGIIDPKTTTVETTVGQYNPETGRINTKYGQLDLVKNTITSNDPKNNKPVAKDVKIDPVSGQITMKNIINPKNNKVEKDFGRILNVKIVPKDDSHKTGAIVLDSKTNQLWKPTGIVDKQYVSSKVDPKTGQIILVYGYLDPKTNEVQPITKMDDNIVKVDSKTGKLYTIIEESDKNGEPLYATTYVDQESGEVYTKVGKYDPVTKTIVLVKIYLISKIDPATGKPQLIDPNSCTVDPVSGRVTKFFNKTVYVYNMVDPITGEIIQVDPNDPRVAGAKTTVVQTLTLTGEIDPVTGRIKTEYGHIDPNTGDIDPATPHFGKEVTVTKETVPISRDEFFEGIKKIEKNTGTVAAAGSVPTVVKTTTKQVITKTDDGVTHNLEEEVRNLGTGEVTYSTQEHKADASGNDTSGAYLQATAVTTRTATTHEDLGKKARTEQLEEKTVGTTRTYDPTKQEQRVVTQEVKTTVTATSGDQ
uniref:Uncharacterized protein n=1 Tax=Megaselia scalaris TaxID=36166 RepID=T1GQI2_MEGSC